MKETKVQSFDVIVLGGGASGLMCAMTAAQRGRRVLLLEGSNKVGKKILMSGGGRCNFTNLYVEAENFISENPHFVKSALSQYTQWDFIQLVQQYQIEYEERKHGQLFCVGSAKEILAMLLAECQKFLVEIKTDCEIELVEKFEGKMINTSANYQVHASVGKKENSKKSYYECESLVVATGALSIPTLGATGFGYELAQQFGLKLLPRRAGLVPFTFSDYFKALSEKLSGLSVDVELSTKNASFKEAILFTHRGLSGPAVLQLSNYWQPGESIFVNLLPEIDLYQHLLELKKNSQSLLRNVLSGLLPKSLVLELELLFWLDTKEKPLAEYSDKLLRSIADNIHAWELKPAATEGYRTAEVTLGGVDTTQISSKTMQAKDHEGLFFIGEVLDVTGHLGGFNFQWAWSSAYVAGSRA